MSHTQTNTPELPDGPLEDEPRGFIPREQRERMLREALDTVVLGAYDERIVQWVLDVPDYATFTAIASWIDRAFARGVQEVFRPAFSAGAGWERSRDPNTDPLCCEFSRGIERQMIELYEHARSQGHEFGRAGEVLDDGSTPAG